MTEHLKKQIDDAASECRSAKTKRAKAVETIKSEQAGIVAVRQRIEALEQANSVAEQTIMSAHQDIVDADAKFAKASARLSFFNNELIDHPYAAC